MKKVYSLNLWNVIALGIGSIVGAGIFALLGQVLSEAGKWTYLSFAISGVIAMLCGYAYAKLAAAYPSSGGLTDYFQHAFPNKKVAGTLSTIYFLTSLISAGTIAKSFGIYAVSLLPEWASSPLYINLLAAFILLSLGFFNMMSAADVGKAETGLVAFKVGILILLIIAGFFHFDDKIASFPVTVTNESFFRSIGITFFAFAGFGVITNASNDVAGHTRTIRRAIYLTLLIVAVLYIGLAFIVMNYVSLEQFNQNTNIAVTYVAQKLLGKTGYVLIYLAALMAFITAINATFFSVFRISKSLATQGFFPSFYHKKFWRRGTFGNVLTVSMLTLITVTVGFNAIVNLSSLAYLVSYLSVIIACWILRAQTKVAPLPVFLGIASMLFILVAFLYSVYL